MAARSRRSSRSGAGAVDSRTNRVPLDGEGTDAFLRQDEYEFPAASVAVRECVRATASGGEERVDEIELSTTHFEEAPEEVDASDDPEARAFQGASPSRRTRGRLSVVPPIDSI